MGDFAGLDGLTFLGGGKINEDGDKDENGILHEENGGDSAGDGEGLPDAGGDVGGLGIGQSGGEEGPEDAATIHGEGGDHIEEDEKDIDPGEIGQDGRGLIEISDIIRGGEAAKEEDEHSGDDNIHKRAGDRDDELLSGLFGHALKASESSDGKEGDIGSTDAETARGEGMSEFVEEDAKEKAAKEDETGKGMGDAAFGEESESKDRKKKNKG